MYWSYTVVCISCCSCGQFFCPISLKGCAWIAFPVRQSIGISESVVRVGSTVSVPLDCQLEISLRGILSQSLLSSRSPCPASVRPYPLPLEEVVSVRTWFSSYFVNCFSFQREMKVSIWNGWAVTKYSFVQITTNLSDSIHLWGICFQLTNFLLSASCKQPFLRLSFQGRK